MKPLELWHHSKSLIVTYASGVIIYNHNPAYSTDQSGDGINKTARAVIYDQSTSIARATSFVSDQFFMSSRFANLFFQCTCLHNLALSSRITQISSNPFT